MNSYTAKEIAGNPDLYNKTYAFSIFGSQDWECMGYSRSGLKIKFGKLLLVDRATLRPVVRYVDIDEMMLTQ